MKKLAKHVLTILNRALRKVGLGFHLYRSLPHSDVIPFDRSIWSGWHPDREFCKLYTQAMIKSESAEIDNVYKQLRFYNLYQGMKIALGSSKIAAVAECGCFKGHSSHFIANFFAEHDALTSFYVFDSFEGLSSRTVRDQAEIELSEEFLNTEKQHFASTESHLRKVLADIPQLEVKKGWIPERFCDVETVEFSFLHLDVDLYEPTYDSLTFFWPRMLKGAVIVIDDYDLSRFEGAKIAVQDFVKGINKSDLILYESPMGGCMILKCAHRNI